MVTYLLPVIALLLGFAVLHERITCTLPLGLALVLIGVSLVHGGHTRPPVAAQ